MAYLFRVYSDSSHGFNGPESFAPAAALALGRNSREYHAPTHLDDMKKQLEIAISGKKTAPSNPFIFFTPSLLLALQFAHFRKGGFWNGVEEQNINITCFEAGSAKTAHGDPVKFVCVEEMVQEHGIEILDNGIPRSHLAEYLTMDCVVLDSTARTASLNDILDAGLYRLYPAIQEVTNNTKFAPRVNLELRKIRKFSFVHSVAIRPCDTARIDLAAKIAAVFTPKLNTNGPVEEKVASHLLAWMLSLTKRDEASQVVISDWLDDNAYSRPSDFMELDPDLIFDESTVPEVQQFYEIWPMMSDLVIGNQVLAATTSIKAKDNEKEIFDWRAQMQIENAEFNAQRKLKQAGKKAETREKNAAKKAKDKMKKETQKEKERRAKERKRKRAAKEKERRVKAAAKRAKDKADKEKAKIAKAKKEIAAQKKELAAQKKIHDLEKKVALSLKRGAM